MKLYRGISSKEFIEHAGELDQRMHDGWRKILTMRESGIFSYPEELNDTIIELSKLQVYARQYFTDMKDIAERYAQSEGGSVIEIDVPLDDIEKYFLLEFQNYAKRREQFEIVYQVRGDVLFEYKDEWKLKVLKTK